MTTNHMTKKTNTTTNHKDTTIKNDMYPNDTKALLFSQLIDTVTLSEIPVQSDNLSHTHSDFRAFEGKSFDYVGQRIFGGQVLAQALMAASQTIGNSNHKPCHSLHGYFLRSGCINTPVIYQVQNLRDGRSLSARRVTAVQYQQQPDDECKEQIIFSMIASYASVEPGLEYQSEMPVYPPPEDLLTEQELKENFVGFIPEKIKARFMRQRHIEIKPIHVRNPINPKPMPPKQANWLRIPDITTQSVAIQQALLAFSSDFYLVGTGLMPHGISFMTKGLQAASIDHSIHFHRSFNISDWLLYDMWSDNLSSAKSLNHGHFWQDGKLIASIRQEGLMRLR